MSFSIQPKAAPAIQQPPGAQSDHQVSARDRAIALLQSKSEHKLPDAPEPTALPPVEQPLDASSQSVDANRQNNTSEGQPSEPVPLAEPKAAEPEKPLSSEYAILARKEKALRARDQQLRAREAAIKAAEDARNAPSKPSFDESRYISKDKLQQDLFGTLSELGLTYDQITAQAVNAPTPEQVQLNQELKAMREELKALKGEQENSKKSWDQQQAESYKQAVSQIRNEAKALITHDPAFETIKETGSIDDVVDLIERTFKEDGVLMTVEEASKEVEDYLVNEALKIARIKKIQLKLQATSTDAPPAKPAVQPQQQQMKTLTNQVSSTRQLSARERAILAATGQLKK